MKEQKIQILKTVEHSQQTTYGSKKTVNKIMALGERRSRESPWTLRYPGS